jgi:nucleotide-binding universal stress UspA family protein
MSDQDSPRPVVVGVDGSDAAMGAALWAAKEAVHQDVPLRLVYVVQTTDGPTASADTYPAEEKYAERSLRAVRLAVEATGVAAKIETAVLRDDVDAALIAESNSATLVCVGSSGIGRVANMVLGSTVAILAEQAQCPVAIIRHTKNDTPPKGGFIAVVVDDKHGPGKVMQWAMEEARARRAPLLALCVGRSWGHFDLGDELFRRRLRHWSRRYPDVGVEVATTRLSLARYLEGYLGAVQLLVIGAEDVHRVPQLVGPRGLPIFAHADCSVLIVRGDHQRSPDASVEPGNLHTCC